MRVALVIKEEPPPQKKNLGECKQLWNTCLRSTVHFLLTHFSNPSSSLEEEEEIAFFLACHFLFLPQGGRSRGEGWGASGEEDEELLEALKEEEKKLTFPSPDGYCKRLRDFSFMVVRVLVFETDFSALKTTSGTLVFERDLFLLFLLAVERRQKKKSCFQPKFVNAEECS